MTEEAQTQDVKLPEPAWVWTKQPGNLQRILEGKHLLPEKGTGLYTADQVRAAVLAEREKQARLSDEDLRLIYAKLESYADCGPSGAGWKSDELSALVAKLAVLISGAE